MKKKNHLDILNAWASQGSGAAQERTPPAYVLKVVFIPPGRPERAPEVYGDAVLELANGFYLRGFTVKRGHHGRAILEFPKFVGFKSADVRTEVERLVLAAMREKGYVFADFAEDADAQV